MSTRSTLILILSLLVFATAHGLFANTPAATSPDDGLHLVEVHWLKEMIQGGMTMIALGVLSVALLAFAVERSIMLRRRFIVPNGLSKSVLPLFQEGRYEEILAHCRAKKSILADIISHLVIRRHDELAVLSQGAGDLGARELNRQEQRNIPFGVIATLAPLLGLLGTMIGMIESFKLVEVFGDEGGASMLAGSISKALITTAGGLVLAVPAVILFNFFKFRLNEYGAKLEEEVELLINAWFKVPAQPVAAHSEYAAVQETQTALSQEDSAYSSDPGEAFGTDPA